MGPESSPNPVAQFRLLSVRGFILTAGAAGTLVAVAYLMSMTAFARYDDEGYLLISLKSFLEGEALYDSVLSQYGPWWYFYHWILSGLVSEITTHDAARWITIAHWVATSLGAGGIGWLLSRRGWVAAAGIGVTFGYLWLTAMSIAHPGTLIAGMLAVALGAALWALEGGRRILAYGILGATAALLLLTKVNVGGFFAISVASFLLATTYPGGRWGYRLAAVPLAVLPWALMASSLSDFWVLPYAISFGLAAFLILKWLRPESSRPPQPVAWAVFASSGGVVLILVVLAVLFHGTSVAGLVDGVLLRPLRHPDSFVIPLSWGLLGWLSLLGLIAVGLWRGITPPDNSRLVDAVAALRLGVAGLFIARAGAWLNWEGMWALTSMAIPLLPIMVLNLGEDRASHSRLLLSLVALGQILHFYPVAGTQMAWGTFLLIPLFLAGIADAVEHLANRMRARWALRLLIPAGLTIVAWLQVVALGIGGWERWSHRESLQLPGSSHLRLADSDRDTFQVLARKAQVHGDVLFSLPGLFSFNLWSGVPSPTHLNSTQWMWLLDDEEQERVRAQLISHDRRVVIRNEEMERFLDDLGVPVSGPLVDHIRNDYQVLITLGGYSLSIPKGVSPDPLGVTEKIADGPTSDLALKASNHANRDPLQPFDATLHQVPRHHRPHVLRCPGIDDISGPQR